MGMGEKGGVVFKTTHTHHFQIFKAWKMIISII